MMGLFQDCLHQVGPAPLRASSCLTHLIFQAKMKASVESNIETRAWMKLIANAAINPLTALHRVPNGHVLSNPHLQSIATELVGESVAVARAGQIDLPSLFGTVEYSLYCGHSVISKSPLVSSPLAGLKEHKDCWEMTRERMVDYVNQVAKSTSSNRSSMLRDLERGRPTEIDFINGYIADQGRRCGVNALLNDNLRSMVKAHEFNNIRIELP